jgi:molybdate-binding protein/DNA-binding XRE family transcriptional regulator
MTNESSLTNCVRARRLAHGWSQDDLATRAGVSRAGIGAIEQGRFVPSAATALALAATFGCRVEDLFSLAHPAAQSPQWAWRPTQDPCRYWRATVAGVPRLYPVEAMVLGTVPHDGVFEHAQFREHHSAVPEQTLVIACCDPAAEILARELLQSHGIRLLAFQRSSRAALALLSQGLVHAAGVHLVGRNHRSSNTAVAQEELHRGFALLRIARWQEGLVSTPGKHVKSVRAAVQSRLRWVGREAGSAVSEILTELLEGRAAPRRHAWSHRGVAEAVRSGWADVGVCLQLVSEEAGLDFVGLRQEDYDLCYLAEHESDPRIQALVAAVRSTEYRRVLQDLPGYDTRKTGDLQFSGVPHA